MVNTVRLDLNIRERDFYSGSATSTGNDTGISPGQNQYLRTKTILYLHSDHLHRRNTGTSTCTPTTTDWTPIVYNLSLFVCQVIVEQTSRQCVQRLPCVRCGVATHKSTPHHRNLCLMSTPSLSQTKTLCLPCPRWFLLPRGNQPVY